MAGPVPAIHVLLNSSHRRKTWMPATGAGMTSREFCALLEDGEKSNEGIVQIVPIGIHRMDQPDLPGARPVLDCLLTLNCVANIVKVLVVDKALKPVTLREPFDHAFTMLKRAVWQIAGDAGVENAIASIGHEVEPAALNIFTKSKTWM